MINFKKLLLLAGVYLTLVGFGFLLMPEYLVLVAVGDTPAGIIGELRQYGGALLGIAAMNVAARAAERGKALNAIFLGNAVGFGLVAMGGALKQMSDPVALGWLLVLIDLAFAIAFVVVRSSKPSELYTTDVA